MRAKQLKAERAALRFEIVVACGLLRGNPGVISWIAHSWQFSEFYVLPFERILTGVKLLPL